ncbi:PepSY-associated TM helix domain-containing protein [Brevundimonas sp.]|uniref:PepSY-associated TM helix domain-containing protein n=1 Tax=Brevundimonas sp. TaxID=1871086 RepID=UPI0037C04264
MTTGQTSTTGRPKKAPPKRSAWWTVHHWAGLKLSLLMTFVMATGTLATVAHELDWLVRPSMRVPVRDQAYASWGDWVEAAQARLGPGGRLDEFDRPGMRGFAVDVLAVDGRGEDFRIQVDPWTARVTGTTGYYTIQRALRETHRHLMLPTDVGLPFVTVLSLPLLAIFVTSFWVYKKWWRGFRRLPKPMTGRRGDLRRFSGDLHRLLGLWSLPFLLLMALTGLWYLIEWGGGEAPEIDEPTLAAAAPPTGAQVDRIIAETHRAYPALHVTGLRFPEDGGVIVVGQAEALLVRDDANAVWWDLAAGAPAQVSRAQDMTAHQRLSEAADPLHFGTWGGLTTKLIWFVFGAALSILSATGAMIYATRLKLAGSSHVGLRIWLLGTGYLGLASAILVAIAIALLSRRLMT